MKMKKLLVSVIAGAMLLTTMAFSAHAEADLKIGTLDELKAFAQKVNDGDSFEGKTVELTADIDLGGEEWTPFGPFSGTFDGGNHTISNLVITAPGQSNVAFFKNTNTGEIKNITFENADVEGYLNVAVVAGTPFTSDYSNVTVTGKIYVDGFSYVGTVGGHNAYGDFTDITVDVSDDSYVNAYSITSAGKAYRTYVGGVVGFTGEGKHTFENVTSNIDVIGSTIDVGGIAGIAHYGTTWKNVSCTGNVTLTDGTEEADALEVGGIAGVWNNGGSPVTFENCVYTGKIEATYTDENGNKVTLTNEDMPNNGIVGKAYSATGTGTLTKDAATVDGQLYHKMSDAIAAIVDGSDVVIFEGTYTDELKLDKKNVRVVADGNVVFKSAPNFKATGLYVEGITFEYVDGEWNYSAGGTYKDCVFKAEQDAFHWGYLSGDTTFDGCTIEAGGAYAFHIDSANGFTTKFIDCTIKGGDVALGANHKTVEFEGCTLLCDDINLWGATDGVFNIKDSYIDITGDLFTGYDAKYKAYMDGCTTADGKNLKDYVWSSSSMKSTVLIDGVAAHKRAKIGDNYYAFLTDAIAAAQDGDEIDLLGIKSYLTKTIDMKKSVTFKNGAIEFSDMTLSGGFGIIVRAGDTVSFEDVELVVDNINVKQGFFYNMSGTVEFIDSTVTVSDVEAPAVFHGGELSVAGKYVFNNSTLDYDAEGTATRAFLYPEVDIVNSNISITNITDNAMRNVKGTIKDSEVLVDGAEYALKNTGAYALTLDNTVFTAVNTTNATENAGIYLGDATLLEEVDSTVNAHIYIPATGENMADTVSVQFVATDDKNVYEIYIVAKDEKTINRLSTAQLKYALVAENDADISYKLAPAANVALTSEIDDTNAYLYNFDGVNYASKTGEKILIGTVEFEGYGKFEFKADDAYSVAKVTSASLTDNIVNTYKINGDVTVENEGVLDLADSKVTVELVEPKRTVNVNIAFNNNITAGNTAAYNDFTVSIVGSNDPATVYSKKIGTDDVDYTDDKAVVSFEVTAGYRYTITVEGAGYRTYRYTTLVNPGDEDIEINLWNNVLTQADVVENREENKVITNVTFLAGDIVKDAKINLYDLSAVVSYFGFEELKTNHPEYARYDLNRDGVIDAKDVAYVLVSWDK